MVANIFGGRKPSSKFKLKATCYPSCGCCDSSGSCEQLKKRVTDKYCEKKVRLWTQVTFHYRKSMLHYNTKVTAIFMTCIFYRNFNGKTSQIEWLFESNLRSFGCFKCFTTLWLPLNPNCNGNLLTRIA